MKKIEMVDGPRFVIAGPLERKHIALLLEDALRRALWDERVDRDGAGEDGGGEDSEPPTPDAPQWTRTEYARRLLEVALGYEAEEVFDLFDDRISCAVGGSSMTRIFLDLERAANHEAQAALDALSMALNEASMKRAAQEADVTEDPDAPRDEAEGNDDGDDEEEADEEEADEEEADEEEADDRRGKSDDRQNQGALEVITSASTKKRIPVLLADSLSATAHALALTVLVEAMRRIEA